MPGGPSPPVTAMTEHDVDGGAQGPLDNERANTAHWPAFSMVTAAYLAVTVSESILAPLFPIVAGQLGLDVGLAGVAFGLLTGAIAVGNLLGGYLLARLGSRPAILASLATAWAGCLVAATASGRAGFLVAQVLIGLGAGLFFAPGISAVGR